MAEHDFLAVYQELADIARQALVFASERDWEALAAQQASESRLMAQLQNTVDPLSGHADGREMQAHLIRQILAAHAQTEALLRPWREELAGQLQSLDSSRMLARTYGAQNSGF